MDSLVDKNTPFRACLSSNPGSATYVSDYEQIVNLSVPQFPHL